jgi:hypothetical protein
MAPAEFQIEFSSVRHLTPRQFVEKLSKELGVHGVVAGKYNWEFNCSFYCIIYESENLLMGNFGRSKLPIWI